jgi:hypothetical protein
VIVIGVIFTLSGLAAILKPELYPGYWPVGFDKPGRYLHEHREPNYRRLPDFIVRLLGLFGFLVGLILVANSL